MTQGELESAVRRAFNIFDEWVDVTGFVIKHSGYYYEIQSIIEDAVHCGAQQATGDFRKLDNEPPDKLVTKRREMAATILTEPTTEGVKMELTDAVIEQLRTYSTDASACLKGTQMVPVSQETLAYIVAKFDGVAQEQPAKCCGNFDTDTPECADCPARQRWVKGQPVAIDKAVQVANHGISVNVGSDGAWVCFKASTGKSFALQPVTQWGEDNIVGAAAREWARDMQQHYEQRASPQPAAESAVVEVLRTASLFLFDAKVGETPEAKHALIKAVKAAALEGGKS